MIFISYAFSSSCCWRSNSVPKVIWCRLPSSVGFKLPNESNKFTKLFRWSWRKVCRLPNRQNSTSTKKSPVYKKCRNILHHFLTGDNILLALTYTFGDFGASAHQVNDIQVRPQMDHNLQFTNERFKCGYIYRRTNHFYSHRRDGFVWFQSDRFRFKHSTECSWPQFFPCKQNRIFNW